MLKNTLDAPEASACEHHGFLAFCLSQRLGPCRLWKGEFRSCRIGADRTYCGPGDETHDERDRKNSAEVGTLHKLSPNRPATKIYAESFWLDAGVWRRDTTELPSTKMAARAIAAGVVRRC